MKISVDDIDLFRLSETQKKVIKNDIDENKFEADMRRRLQWSLTHKYEQCFKRLKEEWEPKLRSRMESIPTSDEKLAELIFSQPDYKSKSSV
jgi:hypothetical protein